MSEARRFDLSYGDETEAAELVERPNGDYVEHSDYAAALAKIAELEQKLATARAKQEGMEQMYGTPEQFEKAIRKAEENLVVTASEAEAAITKYRSEWDAAATGCTKKGREG